MATVDLGKRSDWARMRDVDAIVERARVVHERTAAMVEALRKDVATIGDECAALDVSVDRRFRELEAHMIRSINAVLDPVATILTQQAIAIDDLRRPWRTRYRRVRSWVVSKFSRRPIPIR